MNKIKNYEYKVKVVNVNKFMSTHTKSNSCFSFNQPSGFQLTRVTHCLAFYVDGLTMQKYKLYINGILQYSTVA
jgi:hypothetical protein